MKPQILHKQAMDWSFKAKLALDNGEDRQAFEYYTSAAKCESEAAEFYLNRPELEPTRSLLLRSAAFLNLKAGLVEQSKRFIFFGLLNSQNEQIKSELNDALEFSMSLQSLGNSDAKLNYDYLRILRLRSINYVLEPTLPINGSAVSLEMVKVFTEEYMKSLRAYSSLAFKKVAETAKLVITEIDAAAKQFEELVNPLITSASFGSFRFSIANDFLAREGEMDEIVRLKSNVVGSYHNEVFSAPLTDDYISAIKEEYNEDDVDAIFRPLIKLRQNNSPFKIAYYDQGSYAKKYIGRVTNQQKKKILPTKRISAEQIGYLENTIVHTGSYDTGKTFRSTLFKQQFKNYEFDVPTRIIEPANERPIILNEEILLTVKFNSDKGFNFQYEDLHLDSTDVTYQKALLSFYARFKERILYLKNVTDFTGSEMHEWEVVKRLINTPEAIN